MRPLLSFLLLCSLCLPAGAQQSYLLIRKGSRKVRSYPEGSWIRLNTAGSRHEGYISYLHNDTLHINGRPVPVSAIRTVYQGDARSGFRPETLMYTAMGVVMSTLALRVIDNNNNGTPRTSLAAPALLGFGGLLLRETQRRLKQGREVYPIGRRFRLQVLELRPF